MENPLMPKYMAVHVVVIAGLVVAVTFQVFQSRALTIRLQALESASLRADHLPLPPEPAPRGALFHPDELFPRTGKPEPPPADPIAPRSELPIVESPLPRAQMEQAVARQVDRILAEKYGHLAETKAGDVEALLAKELNLTESQKARIAAHLQRRQEEMHANFESGNLLEGATIKKAMDLDKKYDTLIKNELDAAQQAKYDQMKKEGKFGNLIRVQIGAGEEER